MIGYVTLAIFCLLVGFGLGRLRLHDIARVIKESRKPQGGRDHTVLLDRDSAIGVWKQTFAESSQVARDFFKWLMGTCTAGLTASVAILGVKGNDPQFQAAALAFALALLISAMPMARLTNLMNDDAQKLGSRISRAPKDGVIHVSLPYVWRPGKQTWIEFIAIITLGIAIFIFLKALVK